jgi:hypothetical protein
MPPPCLDRRVQPHAPSQREPQMIPRPEIAPYEDAESVVDEEWIPEKTWWQAQGGSTSDLMLLPTRGGVT